jgi:hypothetical protein
VPDGEEITVHGGMATVTGAGLTSRVESVLGDGTAAVTPIPDGGPLGSSTVVPWLAHTTRVGTWIATLVELTGAETPGRRPCRAAVDDRTHVAVDWPDGLRTTTRLSSTGPPPGP